MKHAWKISVLAGAVLGVAGLSAPGHATAAAAASKSTPYAAVTLPFELHKVPDVPVYYIVGLSGVPDSVNQGHTSNAGFVVTDAGVVVFDALGTPALGYRMLERIREVTDKPIKYIVVSHYHADHIYGLQAFKDHAGNPPVVAQRGTLGYAAGSSAEQGEDAGRRLEQRRQALFPWVDEQTRSCLRTPCSIGQPASSWAGFGSKSRISGRRTRRATPSCW